MPRIVGCYAALNEEEWIKYSLGSLYNVLDRIIFIDGAIANYAKEVRSTDRTLEVVKEIDKDNKIEYVNVDRHFMSLEEQKEVFTDMAEEGDWLLIVDADEIYRPVDILRAKETIETKPDLFQIVPIFLEFYKDFYHIKRPKPSGSWQGGDHVVNITNQRFFKYSDGMHFRCHHPTACDKDHNDTFFHPDYLAHTAVMQDWYIWHFSDFRDYDRVYNKHYYYNKKLFAKDDNRAHQEADEFMKSEFPYVDFNGPLPLVLLDHPLYGKRVIEDCGTTWMDLPVYRDKRVPPIFNIMWKD